MLLKILAKTFDTLNKDARDKLILTNDYAGNYSTALNDKVSIDKGGDPTAHLCPNIQKRLERSKMMP
jgi:hypothetical protein